jgi:hypothetical protein
MDNPKYLEFLGRVLLHVVGNFGGKGWLGIEEDIEVKGINVISCIVGAICDGCCTWREYIISVGEVRIAEDQGGGFMVCEISVFGAEKEEVLVKLLLVLDM